MPTPDQPDPASSPALVSNPWFNPRALPAEPGSSARPVLFHRTMPGYAPTPLVRLDALARELGVGSVVLKNEQSRLGLPAYKVLGGSWALHETIKRRLGCPADALLAFPELRQAAQALQPVTLCTATDGNHGRGIAFMAEALGFRCVVFVPAETVQERINAIASHGARVERVAGSYDDAVRTARDTSAREGYWLCADTAMGGDTRFSSCVQQGYDTLFDEMLEQVGHFPDVLFLQAGVGALAAAGVSFARGRAPSTRVVSVEPVGSNCVQASISAGQPTTIPDHFTIMAGLRAQSVSDTAWPTLRSGLAAAVSIADADARESMLTLARFGVEAGESGAAGLAGLLRVARQPGLRAQLGLSSATAVGVVNTEGATDRAAYAAIVSGTAA